MGDEEKTGAMPLSAVLRELAAHEKAAQEARTTPNADKSGEDLCDCDACQEARARGMRSNTMAQRRAERDEMKPEWARGRMGDKREVYETILKPVIGQLFDLCEAHGVPMFTVLQLSDDDETIISRVIRVPGCNEAMLLAEEAMERYHNLPNSLNGGSAGIFGPELTGGVSGMAMPADALPDELRDGLLRFIKEKLEEQGE